MCEIWQKSAPRTGVHTEGQKACGAHTDEEQTFKSSRSTYRADHEGLVASTEQAFAITVMVPKLCSATKEIPHPCLGGQGAGHRAGMLLQNNKSEKCV